MGCVLITGASGGIGQEMARRFARAGWAVALGCRHNQAAAEHLCATLRAAGHRAAVFTADVRHAAEVEAMFTAVEGELGAVEVLINNAGHAQQKQFQDIGEDEWDAMMDTHAKGAFLCSRRALPAMLRAKRGCILNIASVWGQVGASCEVHYSAAKAAMIGMTQALAKEVAPSGVRVNCIAPGAIDTPMLANLHEADRAAIASETPVGRLGTPEDVAAAALFLAGSGAAFITGQVLRVDGGWA